MSHTEIFSRVSHGLSEVTTANAADDDAALARSVCNAGALSDLPAIAARIAIRLGYQFFLYALQPEPTQADNAALVMTNYPAAWVHRYQTLGYARVDPVLRHALRSSLPLLWRDLKYSDSAEETFRREAESFGLVDGMTVCANGRNNRHSLLSICGPSFRHLESTAELAILQRAQWFGLSMHEKVFELVRAECRGSQAPRLTDQESACLRASTSFLPIKGIAATVGLSERTAKFHLNNAAKKMGVRSRQAAAAKAISIGLIDHVLPPPLSISSWNVGLSGPESNPPPEITIPVRTDS